MTYTEMNNLVDRYNVVKPLHDYIESCKRSQLMSRRLVDAKIQYAELDGDAVLDESFMSGVKHLKPLWQNQPMEGIKPPILHMFIGGGNGTLDHSTVLGKTLEQRSPDMAAAEGENFILLSYYSKINAS
jgi:hypothetical protein